MSKSLTPGERETIISYNDEEEIARVFTHRRTDITKLKKNPAATLIEEGHFGTTAWAHFELPKKFITFRSVRRSVGKGIQKAVAR